MTSNDETSDNNTCRENGLCFWECSLCTFSENPDTFLACKECGTPRPRTSTSSAEAADGEESAECWACEKCTYADNSSDILCCEICGTAKPSEDSIEEISERLNQEEAAATCSVFATTSDSANGCLSQTQRQKMADLLLKSASSSTSTTNLANLIILKSKNNHEELLSLFGSEEIPSLPVTWTIMVFVRDHAPFRQEFLESKQHVELLLKLISGAKHNKNINYEVQALLALLLVYLLPTAPAPFKSQNAALIKECCDFLAHNCTQPIAVTPRIIKVSVQELQLAGQTKGQGRLQSLPMNGVAFAAAAASSTRTTNGKSNIAAAQGDTMTALFDCLMNDTQDIDTVVDTLTGILVLLLEPQSLQQQQQQPQPQQQQQQQQQPKIRFLAEAPVVPQLLNIINMIDGATNSTRQQHTRQLAKILAATILAYCIIAICEGHPNYYHESLLALQKQALGIESCLKILNVDSKTRTDIDILVMSSRHQRLSKLISSTKLRYLCFSATYHFHLQLKQPITTTSKKRNNDDDDDDDDSNNNMGTRFAELHQTISTHVERQDLKGLIQLFTHEKEFIRYPILQMEVLVTLLQTSFTPPSSLSSSTTSTKNTWWWCNVLVQEKHAMTLMLAAFYTVLTVEVKTIMALVVASLLQHSSNPSHLLERSERAQLNGIRDCIDYLCSSTRDVTIYNVANSVEKAQNNENGTKENNDDKTSAGDNLKMAPKTVHLQLPIHKIVYAGEMARGIVARGAIQEAKVINGRPTITSSDEPIFGLVEVIASEPTEAAARASLSRWVCLACTYADNYPTMERCDACGAPRSPQQLKQTKKQQASKRMMGKHKDDTKYNLDDLVNADSPASQLEATILLMNQAETNPVARDRMIDLDAFEALLTVFQQAIGGNHKELPTAAALTIAYFLRSCYPRKIPMTKARRLSIMECLNFLRDSKKEVKLGESEMLPASLLAVSNQARNYFSLIDSQELRDSKTQFYNPKDNPKDNRHRRKSGLRRNRGAGGGAAVNIESTVYFLGSNDLNRKLDAVLSMMNSAKESPTQRAMMQNYGVIERLVDVVHSTGGSTSPELKAFAALTVAYILPSVEDSVLTKTKDELRDCLQTLRSHGSNGLRLRGYEVSSQEVLRAIQTLNLRSKGGRKAGLKTDKEADTTTKAQVTTVNMDLEELHRRKDVVRLLELLRTDSCRVLDAAFLLLVLVKRENDVAQSIRVNGGVGILLEIASWSEASEDLQLAAALIISYLVPTTTSASKEIKEKMEECIQSVQYNDAKAQSIEVRAANKVASSSRFRLEPTSYNYTEDDGYVGILTLNSLGIKLHTESWFWEDIKSCEKDPDAAFCVRLLLANDKKKDHVTLNVQTREAAISLTEDILGRIRIFRQTTTSSDPIQQSGGLVVPRVLDISYADLPEFLGVSVFHLENHFLPMVKATKGFSAKSKFYEIENLEKTEGLVREKGKITICPVDGRMGAAYVHCLEGDDHVGLANHMLSWTWSYSVRDVVDTLVEYCETHNLDPKRTYVWMCCLCLNQHRVAASNKSGISDTVNCLSFGNEFQRRVIGIGRVLVMMRPWGDPANLKRIWCIFELFTALTEHCEVSIVMPPGEKDRMATQLFSSFGQASEHGIDSLYKALNQVKLEQAEASVELDRECILEMIRTRIGFQTVNLLVRDQLRAWVRSVIDDLVKERETYEQQSSTDPHLESDAKLSYSATLKKFGVIYEKYGEFESAHGLYEKCLSIRESILGFDHLDVAESYTDLGRTMFARGLYDESTDKFLSALRIREKLLAKDHLDTARTYFHIGRLFQEMGDTNEALTMMQKCLVIQEDKLGEHDRETAVTYSYIGLLLGESEIDRGCEQGLVMAEKALNILENTAGNEHPDTAFCFYVKAICLQDTSFEEALIMAEHCCTVQTTALGERHSSLAKTYMLLGELLRRKGRPRESFLRFQQALEIHESIHRDNHIIIARTCAHMSVAAISLGAQQEAKAWHTKVLSTLQESNSKLDQTLVIIYTSTGEEYFERGAFGRAAILFRQGVEVMEAMLGKDHPDLAEGFKALGLALHNDGDFTGARQAYQRSLSLRMATMEDDNPEVTETTELIARTTTQWLEQRRNINPFAQ